MEAVLITEENGLSAVKFPNLNILHLYDLPKLTRFSDFTGNSTDLPLWSELWIRNCPEMETFIYNPKRKNMPPKMEYSEMDTQENSESSALPFFDEE